MRSLPNAFDMTEFLKSHPKFMDFNAYPPGGPKNPDFFWGQPLFGYYRSTDPWVIRKHLSMFADAGVDFLFMDYTNSSIYDPELTTFLSVAEELKAKGTAVPRLTFFLNHKPEQKIEALYQEWYKPGKHDEMWFRWEGKTAADESHADRCEVAERSISTERDSELFYLAPHLGVIQSRQNTWYLAFCFRLRCQARHQTGWFGRTTGRQQIHGRAHLVSI